MKSIERMRREPARGRRSLAGLLMGVSIMVAPSLATAQRVDPMVFSLTPTGVGSVATVRMDNTRAGPMTVELAVNAIHIAEDGQETWQPAQDEFQIFPPQSIIQPGQSQAFRVRYVGDPSLTASKSYRFSLIQLPVALPEGESGVGIGITFNTLMNVVPPASRSDLVAAALQPESDGLWTVSLENRGSRYVRLTRTAWTFRASGKPDVTMTGAQLFSDIERNLVPPNTNRRIQIKGPPEMVGAGNVTITISAPPTE